MEPLLVINKCKPHLAGTLKNFFPTRTMIIFAEDAIYIVGMNHDLIESVAGTVGGVFGDAGEILGEFVGGKIGDRRATRKEDANYQKFAKDVETYVAEEKKAHRFEYSSLKKFIYRQNLKLVVGIGEYIGFKFDDDTYFFDVGDKNVVGSAVAIVQELAPQAKITKKTGPMVRRG